MKRAIIFANGNFEQSTRVIPKIKPLDLIIAADGGSLHCKLLGLIPKVIIGDFDSLSPEEINIYQRAGSTIIPHPIHKDETDLELAIRYAKDQGVEEILIFGALGARWDMTLANLLLPAQAAFNNIIIRLLDGTQELTLLRGGETLNIQGSPGEIISLIPLAGDAHGITTNGMEYALNNETIYFGSPRGVSNVLQNKHAHISIKKGILMCIANRLTHEENNEVSNE
jgi:thiamine pyrophosphokinase